MTFFEKSKSLNNLVAGKSFEENLGNAQIASVSDIRLDPGWSCSDSTCQTDDDSNFLTCDECKRNVHFKCTKLPAYQVQRFIKMENQKFVCINCTQIEAKIMEVFSSSPSTQNGSNLDIIEQRITELKDTIIQKLDIIINN